jgi:hypothetical protein
MLLDVFRSLRASLPAMDTGLVRPGRYVVNRGVALGYKHRIDLAKDLPITDRTLSKPVN